MFTRLFIETAGYVRPLRLRRPDEEEHPANAFRAAVAWGPGHLGALVFDLNPKNLALGLPQ